jgi:phosphate transport system permease protein
MSSEVLTPTPPAHRPPTITGRPRAHRAVAAHSTLQAHGEPMVWLTGGALAVALAMIVTLLAKVLLEGVGTFWPGPVLQIELVDGSKRMGEIAAHEHYRPDAERLVESLSTDQQANVKARLAEAGGRSERRSIRIGNFELTGNHFVWTDSALVKQETSPEWAIVVERFADIDRSGVGRFYGFPKAFLIDNEVVAEGRQDVWDQYLEHHDAVLARRKQVVALETDDLGETRRALKAARLDLKSAELSDGVDSTAYEAAKDRLSKVQTWTSAREEELINQRQTLNNENLRYRIRFETADGHEKEMALADMVRAYPANQLSFTEKLGVYFRRWGEFLFDDPRQANTEGGVYPAIWGTVAMTLIMSVLVVPFGVLAALYLREYAKGGPLVSAIRIAINNLAGVPSIVFGVFGLGFFCYAVGGSIDQLFFRAELAEYNVPTFGTGGLMWAAFTLALLTVPVVIVATEEALAAVPGSMREGSYACGASKWQTIRRIVLPRTLPGILTGTILAMARGAGEVAPLMLVGVVKIAPDLPVDSVFPYIHPERSFMHLGFHIYDVGFQSPNSEAAKPMVYTTTLSLISLIALLNIAAAMMRARLRRRFMANQF